MHDSFDKSGETVKNIYQKWGIGVFVLPGVLVAFLIGLLITQPNIPLWISEAAEAEFAVSSGPPEVAPSVVAQPAKEARAANAN